MKKRKLAIVGCGFLGNIIVDAWRDGLLDDYEFAGCLSRSTESAAALAEKAGCEAYMDLDALLARKPDYVIEAAKPAVVREIAEKTLAGGSNLIVLSIGAFADAGFHDTIARTARQAGTKVHLPSGAIGGFDVLRTAALMGGAKASITGTKGPRGYKGTPVFSESLAADTERRRVFSGTAKEAIEQFPTKVNVAVATALATTGPENTGVFMDCEPGFEGDGFRIEIAGGDVRAELNIYSRTAAIAGWSVVALLRNLVSPIVF